MAAVVEDQDLSPPGSIKTQDAKRPSSLSSAKKFWLGLLIVIIIACSWVGSTQTTKSGYSNHDFKAPLFSMWFGTAWMITLFPLSVPFYLVSTKRSVNDLWNHSKQIFSPNGVSVKSILSSTVLFTLIWGVTNYMYSRALMTISATDVTALFSSAPVFVFILSICILKEPPLILRLGSVLLVMSGIVLFSYAEGFESASIIGVVLSVGSAVGAGFYKVLLKWRFADGTFYQMSLFLSSLGLFSTVFLWPLVLALHLLKVEEISDIPWVYICASSALGLLFNLSINFGIAYTFPLFISIGTLLGIPVNAAVDMGVRGVSFFNWKFPASILIVCGFILILLPPSDSEFVQKYFKRTKKHAATLN